MPGHHLTLDLSGFRPSLQIREYWDVPSPAPVKVSEKELLQKPYAAWKNLSEFYLPMMAGLATSVICTARPFIAESEASLARHEAIAECGLPHAAKRACGCKASGGHGTLKAV